MWEREEPTMHSESASKGSAELVLRFFTWKKRWKPKIKYLNDFV